MKIPTFMNAGRFLWTGLLGLALAGVCEGYDIEAIDGVYELVDDEGAVVEMFWNPKTGESPFGFEADGGVTPEFLWREDRRYLAVNGGAARDRQVYLYEIDGGNFSSCEVPSLTEEQRAPLDGVGDDWAASGTEAVRWQQDGTLLLHVWASERVTSDAEPKKGDVWVDVQMDGTKGTVVGTSTAEPMAPDAAAAMLEGIPMIQAPPGDAEATSDSGDTEEESAGDRAMVAPAQLAGEHTVIGRNADGSTYEGTLAIKPDGPLLLMQWEIAGEKTYGTGMIEGMTLGVALDGGVAIYLVMGQAEGIALTGVWKSQGQDTPTEETILIGNAESMDAQVGVRDLNGSYKFLRETGADSQLEGTVEISGDDLAKTVEWTFEDGTMDGEGLALGDGLAVITEEGLAVYSVKTDEDGNDYLAGHSVNGEGEILQESLWLE